jgi:hypothetical protein
MAAEKVCEAHLTSANGHENIRKIHAYIEKNLPVLARPFYSRINNNKAMARWETQEIKRVAKEIQLLAPACDDEATRPDNSEYPWQDGRGDVQTPGEYNFPNIDDENRMIVRLIKLIRTASESYTS